MLSTVAYRSTSRLQPNEPPEGHMPTNQTTMTLKDAAELLTVCRETLRRMAVASEIPAIRIRTRWALPSQFIEDWIAGNRGLWELSAAGTWIRITATNDQVSEV